MAETIIKFPGAEKNTDQDSLTFNKKFSEALQEQPPASCKSVSSYDTVEVITIPRGVKSLPDIATGGKRNPRWGISLSFAVMPELDAIPHGPLMLPQSPSQFFTADNLDELKERIIFEIEKGIKVAKLASENPEAYQQFELLAMQEKLSSLKGLGEDGDS